MARIYTKAGDAGETGLIDGRRVSKASIRVAAYGEVDELNAFVGSARSTLDDSVRAVLDVALEAIQRDLFALGAILADPRPAEERASGDDRLRLDEARVARLEAAIDEWETRVPPLTAFVLPAGQPGATALHVARAVARRAERAVIAASEAGEDIPPVAVVYLNRLSDLLFVAARVANHASGEGDVTW